MTFHAATTHHLDCEACGERVVIPTPRDAEPMIAREQEHSPAAGRATIHCGGVVIHECADGAYVPPDKTVPSKAN